MVYKSTLYTSYYASYHCNYTLNQNNKIACELKTY